MKVDIWSDTRCPFCYIGKKNFEKALQDFPHQDQVEVRWHSFQLDPNLKTDVSKNHYEYISEVKGIPMSQMMQMHDNLIQIGKKAGIDFNFDEVKVSNSFRSQMLIQMAKAQGKADEMEEIVFKAYFIDGKNVDDTEVLAELGQKVGLRRDEVLEALESQVLKTIVNNDIAAANAMGIRGVPFFIINEKYGVSGAQPVDLFSEVLEKSWNENAGNSSSVQAIQEGDSCGIDENC